MTLRTPTHDNPFADSDSTVRRTTTGTLTQPDETTSEVMVAQEDHVVRVFHDGTRRQSIRFTSLADANRSFDLAVAQFA